MQGPKSTYGTKIVLYFDTRIADSLCMSNTTVETLTETTGIVALMLIDLRAYEAHMLALGVTLAREDLAARLFDAALDHTPAAHRAGDHGAWRHADDVQRFYDDALATLDHCDHVAAINDAEAQS